MNDLFSIFEPYMSSELFNYYISFFFQCLSLSLGVGFIYRMVKKFSDISNDKMHCPPPEESFLDESKKC